MELFPVHVNGFALAAGFLGLNFSISSLFLGPLSPGGFRAMHFYCSWQ